MIDRTQEYAATAVFPNWLPVNRAVVLWGECRNLSTMGDHLYDRNAAKSLN